MGQNCEHVKSGHYNSLQIKVLHIGVKQMIKEHEQNSTATKNKECLWTYCNQNIYSEISLVSMIAHHCLMCFCNLKYMSMRQDERFHNVSMSAQ